MDLNAITTIVSSVGFPIFACCVMFTQNQNLQKTLTEISVTMQKLADDLDNLGDKKDEKGN